MLSLYLYEMPVNQIMAIPRSQNKFTFIIQIKMLEYGLILISKVLTTTDIEPLL